MGNWKDHWIDYYDILGVEFGSPSDSIKKKYRELARIYHPDTYAGEDGDEKFKLIREAYEVLSNEEERKMYDEFYQAKLHGTDEMEEKSTYTDEEIRNTYSQEEIRFAEKVSLRGIIVEELNKAKIILDAKNELLYAAYKDEFDKEHYFDTLKMFVTSFNEYLLSLIELKDKAFEYDLLEEKDAIEEVISFLEEIINTIPISPRDAKFEVEKELIKQQLEERKTQEIYYAQKSIEDFLNFYKDLYNKKISRIEFDQYYDVLILNLQDAQSRLENILPLLKNSQLEEDEIIKTIGQCKEYLSIFSKDYEKALLIGEKEILQETMFKITSDYEQIHEKLKKIIKIIARYPINKKISTLYNYAKEIIKQAKKEMNQYLKEYSKDLKLELYEQAFLLSKEALEIFEKSSKISEEIKETFEKKEQKEYDHKTITYLSEEAFHNIDKIKALELLNQARECIAKNDTLYHFYTEHCQKEFLNQIQNNLLNLNTIEDQLNQMYTDINNIIMDFNTYNLQNPQNPEYSNIFDNNEFWKALKLMSKILYLNSGILGSILLQDASEEITTSSFLTIFSIISFGVCVHLFADNQLEKKSNDLYIESQKGFNIQKKYYDLKDGKYEGSNGVFLRK